MIEWFTAIAGYAYGELPSIEAYGILYQFGDAYDALTMLDMVCMMQYPC